MKDVPVENYKVAEHINIFFLMRGAKQETPNFKFARFHAMKSFK